MKIQQLGGREMLMLRKRRFKPGVPPGTLVPERDPAREVKISVIENI